LNSLPIQAMTNCQRAELRLIELTGLLQLASPDFERTGHVLLKLAVCRTDADPRVPVGSFVQEQP
jgi:hypothetical protein